MDDIKFEVDQAPRMNLSTIKESSFAKWIVKIGVTDNITTANYILVGIGVVCIGITIVMYARIFSGPKRAPMVNAEGQPLNVPAPLNSRHEKVI